MSYIQAKLALQEGLLDYFQGLLEESIQPSASDTSEEISEDFGVIVHFPLVSILNEAKRISAYRAKYTPNQQGEPDMSIALTTDEDVSMYKVLKQWANKVFDEIGSVSKKVPSGYNYEDSKQAIEYTNQTAFSEGELYTVSTVLYRCLSNTEEIPSDESIYWMKIDDGDVKRVYFSMILTSNWDTNASDLLELSIFNALVSAILKEWYRLIGRINFYQEFSAEYERNIADARSATYRRISGLTISQRFL